MIDAKDDRERVQAYSLSLLEGCAVPPTVAQEVALRQVSCAASCVDPAAHPVRHHTARRDIIILLCTALDHGVCCREQRGGDAFVGQRGLLPPLISIQLYWSSALSTFSQILYSCPRVVSFRVVSFPIFLIRILSHEAPLTHTPSFLPFFLPFFLLTCTPFLHPRCC